MQSGYSRHWCPKAAPAETKLSPTGSAKPLLSARETEILVFINKGSTNREIADALSLSRLTIESHVKNIYKKLAVKTRTQAIFEARAYGVLTEARPLALTACSPSGAHNVPDSHVDVPACQSEADRLPRMVTIRPGHAAVPSNEDWGTMAGSERFLVTGALGCIGAWTVRRLVQEGVPVVAFDADADVRRLRLLMDEAQLSRVDIVRGDITNLSLLEETLDAHRITHVIHLAALLHPRFRSDPPLGARVNVLGGVNLFEAVARRAQRIPRIVYASSIAVYDKSDAADDVAIMHHSPAHPTTLYGVFKQAEEAMARVYFQDRGVSSIGLRPATVFGAGRDYGLTAAPTQAVLAAALGRHSIFLIVAAAMFTTPTTSRASSSRARVPAIAAQRSSICAGSSRICAMSWRPSSPWCRERVDR